MSIDLGGKVKPFFSEEQFNWFVKNGIERFLKLVGKAPAEEGRRKHTKTFSSIAKHIQGGFNIGVALPHGVVVLDIDTKEDKDGFAAFDKLLADAYPPEERPSIDDLIKSTFAVRSGGGGLHLYFRHDPAQRARGSLRDYKGVDIKASNAGYLVAPGGVHPNTGKVYAVENQPEGLAPLPAQLAAFVMEGIRDPIATRDEPSSSHAMWGIAKPAEIADLLDVLDPREFREYVGDGSSWINLMAAVHHATAGDVEAMDVFADWSARDHNYAEVAHKEVECRWPGFKDRRNTGQVSTIGTLLSAVRASCAESELLGEASGSHSKALHAVASLQRRSAAMELEEIIEGEDTPNLLAWIKSRPAGWYDKDKEALHGLIAQIADLPDLHWPELTGALSESINGKLSPLQVQRLVQKEITRRKKEEDDKKPTYADTVALITQESIEALSGKDNLMAPPSKQLFRYGEGYWQELADNTIDVASWAVIKRVVKTSNKNAKPLNKYAADAYDCVFREISTTSTELYEREKPPCCINLLNKTLWFKEDGSYKLKDHNRADMLTSRFDYKYDPAAKCPSMDTMMLQVTEHIAKKYSEDERAAFIDHFWELIGYAIQPKKEIPVVMFWIGRGQNGKSKISEIITELVGKRAVLSKNVERLFNMSDNHADASLEGKRLIITDDLNKGTTLKDGDLKSISRNTLWEINPKNKPKKSIYVEATPIIIGNSPPKLIDTSEGFQRRIYAFYFDTSIKHLQKSMLPTIAKEKELPGILNRAVEGYSRFMKRGDFCLPKSANDFRVRFLVASSPILAFWESLDKTQDAAAMESTSDLYDRYRTWTIQEGAGKPQSKADFVEALVNQNVEADGTFVLGWSVSRYKNGVPT